MAKIYYDNGTSTASICLNEAELTAILCEWANADLLNLLEILRCMDDVGEITRAFSLTDIEKMREILHRRKGFSMTREYGEGAMLHLRIPRV
mgnify:CR=1 FL=1